ncbi:hypothetical protein [Desulfopila sp. IMCC35008]|uniref:hypothetical protein n=1 Tax=Desulfopila sp. IMCC35008 TaxID=2653858 RepID=UPI0013D403D7|nr:hypothetical protein [Desulfopila sp. IMCC35008]
MLLNNSAQTYARPVTAAPLRQHLTRRQHLELPGGLQLWKRGAKFAALLLLLVCTCQLGLGQFRKGLIETIELTRLQQLKLADEHISLRARRAALLMPDNIEQVAASTLALQSPEPGQVSRYNQQKGRFERL